MKTLGTTGAAFKGLILGALVVSAMAASPARAEVIRTVNGGDTWNGFMNVFELPSNGGGHVFGSPWGIGDLVASFTGNNLTMSPNTIGDPNVFWYQCVGSAVPPNCGGPGAPGNKVMEANMYVEQNGGGPLTGDTVIFTGQITLNTLTSAHVATAFIRDFASDFSSVVETTVPLPASGNFTLSLATINDNARHVQYGIQLKGENVWSTDVAPFGAVTVSPDAPVSAQTSTWGRLKMIYR